MADYKAMSNKRVLLGVGKMPRANPYFGSLAEDMIRHEHQCCGMTPGPKIPSFWYDAGLGWVTKYFTDVESYDRSTSTPGRFRCQVRGPKGEKCSFEVVDEKECCTCEGTPCWDASGNAPTQMLAHLIEVHKISPENSPQRDWATGFCETEGCLDVCFCTPCNGSRQMMALAGWEDTMDWGWCAYFCCLGIKVDSGGDSIVFGNVPIVYYEPPFIYIAAITRPILLRLHNIDEHRCASLCIVCFCPLCSVAQTNRELAAAGVWPGSTCGGAKPGCYKSITGRRKVPMKQLML